MMNLLPKEILEIIYSYLTQKSLARCGLVCRNWYLATRLSRYYFTIRLTNNKQLSDFIEIAMMTKINDIPIGYFVHHLYLEDLFKMQKDIPITQLIALYNACPNIEYIDTLHTHRANAKNVFPLWKKLTHINKWVTIHNKGWLTELVMQHEQQQQNTFFHSIQSLEFFEYDYNNKITKMNHKKHFSFYNNHDSIYTSKLSHGTFFLSFTFTWYYLTDLSISFEYSFFHGEPYQLNDHTFESIHQSCPSLESLTLKELELSISEDYLLNKKQYKETFNHQGIKEEEKLTSLHLINCIIIHSSIFKYLKKKYPLISTLELYLDINENEDVRFSTNFFYLISGLTQLKHLFVTFEYVPELLALGVSHEFFEARDRLFPHEEFRQWLLNNHSLESLKYPYDLSWSSKVNPSYLELYPAHSVIIPVERSLALKKIPNIVLNELFLNMNPNHVTPIQATNYLTTLIVHGFKPYQLRHSILIYLNLFPHLKTLELTYARLFDYDLSIDKDNEVEKKDIVVIPSPTLYALETLAFHHVRFDFYYKLNHFFNQFPNLKILYWNDVTIYCDYKKRLANDTGDNTQESNMYINLTYLDLDGIYLKNIHIDKPPPVDRLPTFKDNKKHHPVIVNEIRDHQVKNSVNNLSSKGIEPMDGYLYGLQIDCRSVDTVQLK